MDETHTGRGGATRVALYTVYGVAMIAQLCLLFLLPAGAVRWLALVGWGLFAISAILGWLPILVFRRQGRVTKGKSYIHTTALVTSGLYAIVRYPQFLASDFLAVAVMCITQHSAVYLAGTMGVAASHLTMIKADRDLVTKFGEPHREYMQRVPRWNLLAGLWRRHRRSRPRQKEGHHRLGRTPSADARAHRGLRRRTTLAIRRWTGTPSQTPRPRSGASRTCVSPEDARSRLALRPESTHRRRLVGSDLVSLPTDV
jgi:protein-S-isoprenylcysteine O-methyltransferase Ste14